MFLVKREHRKLKDADIKKLLKPLKNITWPKFFYAWKTLQKTFLIICHFENILKWLQVATDNELFFD